MKLSFTQNRKSAPLKAEEKQRLEIRSLGEAPTQKKLEANTQKVKKKMRMETVLQILPEHSLSLSLNYSKARRRF